MKHLFLILICLNMMCNAVPVKDGLLSLPTSQQLSHLFSSAGNMVDAHDLLAVSNLGWWKGNEKSLGVVTPGILYGVSNKFSVFFNIPLIPENRINRTRSSGIEDIFIQGEYSYFHKESDQSFMEGTLVGALFLPTGSSNKNPPTGAGAPGFFLGTTIDYTSIQWYWFLSPFILINTSHHGTQFGNQFLYQGGVAHNILSKPEKYITAIVLGFSGISSQKDILKGIKNNNSGGTVCYIGPSVWLSTQRFSCQTGIMFAAAQHLSGQQNKNNYLLGVDLRWKFNG